MTAQEALVMDGPSAQLAVAQEASSLSSSPSSSWGPISEGFGIFINVTQRTSYLPDFRGGDRGLVPLSLIVGCNNSNFLIFLWETGCRLKTTDGCRVWVTDSSVWRELTRGRVGELLDSRKLGCFYSYMGVELGFLSPNIEGRNRETKNGKNGILLRI